MYLIKSMHYFLLQNSKNSRRFFMIRKPNVILSSSYVVEHYRFSSKVRQDPHPSFSNVIQKSFEQNSFESESNPKEQNHSQAIRSIKYSVIFLGACLISISAYVIIEFGAPNMDNKGKPIVDEFSDMPLWKQYLYRTSKQMFDFATIIKQPSRDKLLPDEVQYPYYQPPYTLILEFTDVMVHPEWTYKTGWRFKKRPGLDYLLDNLSGLYEVVVYTAEQGITVFPIIETLDPKNLITYKLVRDATYFVDGHHVKDLDKLNRNLNKVIVVDWNSESLRFHPDNLFHIPRWSGSDTDQTLIDLTIFLKTVAINEVNDVRDVLQYYRQFDDPLATFKEKQRAYFELLEQQAKEKPKFTLNLFKW